MDFLPPKVHGTDTNLPYIIKDNYNKMGESNIKNLKNNIWYNKNQDQDIARNYANQFKINNLCYAYDHSAYTLSYVQWIDYEVKDSTCGLNDTRNWAYYPYDAVATKSEAPILG